MGECSLDLIVLLGEARPFGFWWDRGCFFPIDETSFFRQSESIYFCNHRKCFYKCY